MRGPSDPQTPGFPTRIPIELVDPVAFRSEATCAGVIRENIGLLNLDRAETQWTSGHPFANPTAPPTGRRYITKQDPCRFVPAWIEAVWVRIGMDIRCHYSVRMLGNLGVDNCFFCTGQHLHHNALTPADIAKCRTGGRADRICSKMSVLVYNKNASSCCLIQEWSFRPRLVPLVS